MIFKITFQYNDDKEEVMLVKYADWTIPVKEYMKKNVQELSVVKSVQTCTSAWNCFGDKEMITLDEYNEALRIARQTINLKSLEFVESMGSRGLMNLLLHRVRKEEGIKISKAI